jgi:hypothetical protein
MEKRRLFSGVALCIGLLALFSACRKEPTKPTWDVDVAVPLIITSLTIGDLVPDSLLVTNPANEVSLVYTSRLFSLDLDTVLAAPDTSFTYGYPRFMFAPLVGPNTEFAVSDDFTRFDLDELELRELRIRSGMVHMEVMNTMGGILIGHFGLPGATLNGVPFSQELLIPAGTQSTPSITTSSSALDGYVFDLRGPDHNDVNTLETDFSFVTDPNGPALQVLTGDTIGAKITYSELVPDYARGYFGTQVIEIEPSTTALDLFQDITGTLDLDQVTTRLKVRNGIGVDARINTAYLRSINTNNGNTVDLQHAIINGPINLDRAIDLGNGFQAATNSFELNNGNSNIDAFVENLPGEIGYAMDITIDPLGDISNGNDFLYHESALTADLEVEIPLNLVATDLILRKDAKVELPGTLDQHAFQSGTLHFFVTNGFPFSAALNFSIVNEQGDVLTPLAPGGVVPSAALDMNNVVEAAVEGHVPVYISKEQVDLLYAGGLLRIEAAFSTADQSQYTQILSTYRLDVQVTLEGSYMVNGDE